MGKKKSNKKRVSLYVPQERWADIDRAMKQRGLNKKTDFFIDAAHHRALEIITEDARRKALENSASAR